VQLEKKIAALEKGTRTAPGFGPVNRDLARLLFSVENADVRPSQSVSAAVQQTCELLGKNLQAWQELNAQDIPRFNGMLGGAKAAALPVASTAAGGCE
jgi:hypothetical protein